MVQAMVSILLYAGHAGKQVSLCTILLNGHYIYSPHARRCSTDYRNLVCAVVSRPKRSDPYNAYSYIYIHVASIVLVNHEQ